MCTTVFGGVAALHMPFAVQPAPHAVRNTFHLQLASDPVPGLTHPPLPYTSHPSANPQLRAALGQRARGARAADPARWPRLGVERRVCHPRARGVCRPAHPQQVRRRREHVWRRSTAARDAGCPRGLQACAPGAIVLGLQNPSLAKNDRHDDCTKLPPHPRKHTHARTHSITMASVIIPVNTTVGRSGVVLITLKSQRSIPPLRIENRCKRVVVRVKQAGWRPDVEG